MESVDLIRTMAGDISEIVPLLKQEDEGSEIQVLLEDTDLWNAFNGFTNEMILTKKGRRMFPVLRVRIQGLKPTTFYSILLEFRLVDPDKWKFTNGRWAKGGRSCPPVPRQLCQHHDSPNFGSYWNGGVIAFSKVKLTNRHSDLSEQVLLQTLHKYEPWIHIVRVDPSSDGNHAQKIIKTFAFPSAQFIAVTAYQNQNVTALKIQHNPFAKAFQENKAPGKRKRSVDEVAPTQQLQVSSSSSSSSSSGGNVSANRVLQEFYSQYCSNEPHQEVPPPLNESAGGQADEQLAFKEEIWMQQPAGISAPQALLTHMNEFCTSNQEDEYLANLLNACQDWSGQNQPMTSENSYFH